MLFRSQMDAERRKAQRERDALTARIASLGVAAREARLERRDAESDLVQMEKKETESSRHRSQAAKDMAAAKVLEENNKKEQDRQEKVEKDLKESPSVASTLVFNPPKGQLLWPILVELSGNGVAVMSDENSGAENLGWGLIGPPDAFVKWFAGRTKANEYIVIMLRPSGIARLEATRTAIIAAGLEVGLELVSDEMDIVLAESNDTQANLPARGGRP